MIMEQLINNGNIYKNMHVWFIANNLIKYVFSIEILTYLSNIR
jgi:hypothetical protein